MKTKNKKLISKKRELVFVEAMANVHWHGREGVLIMLALIKWAILGGVDVLFPMPNLKKGLATARRVVNYLKKLKELTPKFETLIFRPIVMLTENTTYEELVRCVKNGIKDGKMYPYLRTTKSKLGVRRYSKMLQVVRWCGELGIKVHIHFEHPNSDVNNRDAEYSCWPVCEMFLESTDATIIWEHGSDSRCIPIWKGFAKKFPGRFYLTLTAHHLAWDEDSSFGDVRKVCKPPIKTNIDREALVRLVCEDHNWVMAGGDDAAHDIKGKHKHTGKCACGAFTSPFLVQLYAHALDCLLQTKEGVEIFNRFISRNARILHNLPKASRILTLWRNPFRIPKSYKVGPWTVEPPGADDYILYTNCRM